MARPYLPFDEFVLGDLAFGLAILPRRDDGTAAMSFSTPFFRDDETNLHRTCFTAGRGVEPAGFPPPARFHPTRPPGEWGVSPEGVAASADVWLDACCLFLAGSPKSHSLPQTCVLWGDRHFSATWEGSHAMPTKQEMQRLRDEVERLRARMSEPLTCCDAHATERKQAGTSKLGCCPRIVETRLPGGLIDRVSSTFRETGVPRFPVGSAECGQAGL
ncbi:hypothetical protein SAMN04488498_114106 [Mesorhizobium albiziae]|uniref:Uncharacterized protein n=1 Tax=Neomesorhizobium albiziae TaxID=335020 RepID=A0A1I4CVZ7_9HYPH|nr:hypothetical protein SAMN04488498_114106 [Mesorhizobium albiziae]